MRFRQERIKISHCTEDRIDLRVVRRVIAKIGHRRGIDRRQPDGVNAEPSQVGQPPFDSGGIANTVSVAILKRSRIDLVNNGGLPPRHRVADHRTHSFSLIVPSLTRSKNGPSRITVRSRTVVSKRVPFWTIRIAWAIAGIQGKEQAISVIVPLKD